MCNVLFFIQTAVDRRSWPQSSGLMPVFEEDEEGSELREEEEDEEPGERAHAQESLHIQRCQVINGLIAESIHITKLKSIKNDPRTGSAYMHMSS